MISLHFVVYLNLFLTFFPIVIPLFLFVCLFSQMWWGGIHSELDAAIQDLLDAGHYLHFLDFGDDGSYFVSYD
jgi:hypothetical protein